MSSDISTTKQSQWFRHIEDWSASQLSQKSFCEQHNLSFAQFGYWRKRYQKQKETSSQTVQPHPWVTLTPTMSNPISTGQLTITIGQHCKLALPINSTPTQLEVLFNLLGLKHVFASR